ncbi:hypothetical protein GCM10009564_11650 [Streptomyces thermogriseus]|uniref:Uncharacterized protein n=1 Tax=Streptomyces thermogriseus TaxID=75292 RepID=A0ABN1SUW3_9ACTN
MPRRVTCVPGSSARPWNTDCRKPPFSHTVVPVGIPAGRNDSAPGADHGRARFLPHGGAPQRVAAGRPVREGTSRGSVGLLSVVPAAGAEGARLVGRGPAAALLALAGGDDARWGGSGGGGARETESGEGAPAAATVARIRRMRMRRMWFPFRGSPRPGHRPA